MDSDNDTEEQEVQRDKRYKGPCPEEGRVMQSGYLFCTKTNEAW